MRLAIKLNFVVLVLNSALKPSVATKLKMMLAIKLNFVIKLNFEF